jgi:NAD(P)H-flavin reductase
MAFYRALAEIGPSQSGIRDFPNPVLANRTVIFGIDTPVVTADVGWYVEIQLPAGQVWRPTSAWICAHEAPTTDALIDCSYSTDSGVTWNNLFESAAGDLVLEAGLIQTANPLGRFSGFPTPLDIPAGALMRCAVIAAGGGAAYLVNIAGEVRKATPVTNEEP